MAISPPSNTPYSLARFQDTCWIPSISCCKNKIPEEWSTAHVISEIYIWNKLHMHESSGNWWLKHIWGLSQGFVFYRADLDAITWKALQGTALWIASHHFLLDKWSKSCRLFLRYNKICRVGTVSKEYQLYSCPCTSFDSYTRWAG